jgi:uncharacterized membrane protein
MQLSIGFVLILLFSFVLSGIGPYFYRFTSLLCFGILLILSFSRRSWAYSSRLHS